MTDSITDRLRDLCDTLEPEPVDRSSPSATERDTNSTFLAALRAEWTRHHPRARMRTEAPAVRVIART